MRHTSAHRTYLLYGLLSCLVMIAPAQSFADDVEAATQLPQAERGVRRAHRSLSYMERLGFEAQSVSGFEGAGHEYLRFVELPDEATQLALRERGVLLVGYVGDHTYSAAVTGTGRELLTASESGIERKGAIPIEHKLDTRLSDATIPAWALHDSGRLLVDIRFHGNTTLGDARALIQAHDGIVMGDSTFPGYLLLQAALASDAIPELAGFDSVWNVTMKPPRLIPHNQEAAGLAGAEVLWQAPYNLNGAGYGVAVWDLGAIYPHPELLGRVSYPNPAPFFDHATQVAGTIGASGNLGTPDSQDAHGMASMVQLLSYDANNFNNEYFSAIVAGNSVIAYNGFGYAIGWEYFFGCDQSDGCLPPIPPQWLDEGTGFAFGDYLLQSFQADDAADFAEETGKTFLIVTPAGNHRDDPGPNNPHDGVFFYNPDEVLDYSYYDSIGPLGMAKNVLTVGSVQDNKKMTFYSGWGPADDGRIKPDLVAAGHGVYTPSGTDGYQVQTGTSMAAAVVAGSAVLVTEEFENVFGAPPTNGELKALLLNTALDLGNPGPDYVYGFGMLQAQAAVELIHNDGISSSIQSGDVGPGQTDSFILNITPGTPSIRCTLAWMDEPGNYTLPGPWIVNDLDLILTSPGGQDHYPFRLDPLNPVADATATGPNPVDTVEQVVIQDPEPGNWTVKVTGTSVPVSPQKYGLVSRVGLSGPKIIDFLPPAVLSDFPYPYRRPILSARYFDPSGSGIDVGSVRSYLNSFEHTDDHVVTEDSVYWVPNFDLWLGDFLFRVKVTNGAGVETTDTMYFNIVEAGQVQNLIVGEGGPGEALLNWGNPVYNPQWLWFRGFRVYRSTDLQENMELIGETFLKTFTDSNPPAGLVNYEVHALFEGGSRILSTRDTPYRTQQPFIAFPRDIDFEPFPEGSFEVVFRGMAEPGSTVAVHVDGGQLGTALTDPDGSFELNHDFGGPGAHTVFVQAKAVGKGISVPSVEVDFEIPAASSD